MADYITTVELAKRAGVTNSWICRQIREGKLYADKIGNHWLIEPDDADEWMRKRLYKAPCGKLTTDEAADMLHTTRSSINYMCKTGKLDCERVSQRRILVSFDSVLDKIPPEERPF